MTKQQLTQEFVELFSSLNLVILSSQDKFLIQTLNLQLQNLFQCFIAYSQDKDYGRSKDIEFQLANLDTTLSILFYLKKLNSLQYLEAERALLLFRKSFLELNMSPKKKNSRVIHRSEFFSPRRTDVLPPNPTKKKILGFIGSSGETLNSDIFSYFSDISKRTLKRHLSDLIGTGYINRESQGKKVYYKKQSTNLQKILKDAS